MRFEHNEKAALTRGYSWLGERKKKEKFYHAIPHSRSTKYIYPWFYERTVVLQIQKNAQDSETIIFKRNEKLLAR